LIAAIENLRNKDQSYEALASDYQDILIKSARAELAQIQKQIAKVKEKEKEKRKRRRIEL